MSEYYVEGQLPRLRVLVVDDEEDAVTTLATFVRRWGYAVETAYNGMDAVAMAKSYHPDVMFLDIGLPDIDGFQVAERVHALPELKEMRLVAISGYGCQERRNHLVESRIHEFLLKPVNPFVLENILAAQTARQAQAHNAI
jgi:CheY-like chemotaxis protein